VAYWMVPAWRGRDSVHRPYLRCASETFNEAGFHRGGN
jgi:hypothetical protein